MISVVSIIFFLFHDATLYTPPSEELVPFENSTVSGTGIVPRDVVFKRDID